MSTFVFLLYAFYSWAHEMDNISRVQMSRRNIWSQLGLRHCFLRSPLNKAGVVCGIGILEEKHLSGEILKLLRRTLLLGNHTDYLPVTPRILSQPLIHLYLSPMVSNVTILLNIPTWPSLVLSTMKPHGQCGICHFSFSVSVFVS